MIRSHFLVIKLKKFILESIFVLFAICLILFSKNNLLAAKNGLALFANSVVPSLFPFFVATELLSHTNIIEILGNVCNCFMKPLFNVRGEGSFAFIMGIISGYPIGAKIASKFRENGTCSKEECERLLSFTNNSGPLFIIATVGISMFGNSSIGFLLLFTHLLASISVGIIFRFWKHGKNTISYSKNPLISNQKNLKFSKLGEIFSSSITSSINTLLLIGGFIVLFSVVISILKTSNILNILANLLYPVFNVLHIPSEVAPNFIAGIFELTNGLSLICDIHVRKLSTNIVLAAFLLGFGGISVLLQVWSVISKTDLSIKPYIIGKILQANFAAIYTYIFLNVFPFLNFDL